MTRKKENIHTISILVANKPGVLIRCAQIYARRGFNIDALVVSPSVNPKFSRMTITLQGEHATLEQIIKQTAKLIDVVHVDEHTELDAIAREFALFKIKKSSASINAIKKSSRKYRTAIVDDKDDVIIVQQAGETKDLDAFEEMVKKYGIIEMVRSGKIVMTRGKEET